MRAIILLLVFFVQSCNSIEKKPARESARPESIKMSLDRWVFENSSHLKADANKLMHEYFKREGKDPNFYSATVTVTKNALGALGQLARIAGDSSECIVVDVTFDTIAIQSIKVGQAEKNCEQKLMAIHLNPITIEGIEYGKSDGTRE